MSASDDDYPLDGGRSSSSSSPRSSYSVSISSTSSNTSEGPVTRSPGAISKKNPGVVTAAVTKKPFAPPKVVRTKNIAIKRPLPKRTPLPHAASIPKAAETAPDMSKRENQLAALQSQLMMSRAAIGQRWKDAWKSADSSAISYDSDLNDFDDSDFLDGLSSSNSLRKGGQRHDESSDSEPVVSSRTSLTASAAHKDLLRLLEREISSSSSLSREGSDQTLNLTASDFIDDLKTDPVYQDSGEPRPSAAVEETIMPRPLQRFKVKLFKHSHPESSCSSEESSDSSAPEPTTWPQLPSRETSVPGEELEESESEPEAEAADADDSEGAGIQERDGEDKSGEIVEEEAEQGESSPRTEQEEPQVKWEIDEAQQAEVSPPQPKEHVAVRRTLRAADLAVNERLDEDACQEDFNRREVSKYFRPLQRYFMLWRIDQFEPKIVGMSRFLPNCNVRVI